MYTTSETLQILQQSYGYDEAAARLRMSYARQQSTQNNGNGSWALRGSTGPSWDILHYQADAEPTCWYFTRQDETVIFDYIKRDEKVEWENALLKNDDELGVATITITINGENGHTHKYEIQDLGNARYIEAMVSGITKSEKAAHEH